MTLLVTSHLFLPMLPNPSSICSQNSGGVREGGVSRLGGWAERRDVEPFWGRLLQPLPFSEKSHASLFLSACLVKGFLITTKSQAGPHYPPGSDPVSE